jgi:hypothetical protein
MNRLHITVVVPYILEILILKDRIEQASHHRQTSGTDD